MRKTNNEIPYKELIHFGTILTIIVIISQLFFTVFTILFLMMSFPNWAYHKIYISN